MLEIVVALVVLGGIMLGIMGLLPPSMQREASKIGAIGKQYINKATALVSTLKSNSSSKDVKKTNISPNNNGDTDKEQLSISESWGLSWIGFFRQIKK